jgi:hypothetical protein
LKYISEHKLKFVPKEKKKEKRKGYRVGFHGLKLIEFVQAHGKASSSFFRFPLRLWKNSHQ